jgi:hypothetical protein
MPKEVINIKNNNSKLAFSDYCTRCVLRTLDGDVKNGWRAMYVGQL